MKDYILFDYPDTVETAVLQVLGVLIGIGILVVINFLFGKIKRRNK